MAFEISSRQFTYDKQTKRFTAEASELRILPGMKLGSFYIRSARTGDVRLFLLSETERDAGGEDILAFHYISPGQGLTATIFND
jgi:hypothetical protein